MVVVAGPLEDRPGWKQHSQGSVADSHLRIHLLYPRRSAGSVLLRAIQKEVKWKGRRSCDVAENCGILFGKKFKYTYWDRS